MPTEIASLLHELAVEFRRLLKKAKNVREDGFDS